jgi:excisionase family DNA binding protein
MPTSDHEGLMDYRAASKFLGVPVGTLYSWVHLRRIPHLRITGKMVRFDPEELRRWLEARRVPAAEASRSARTVVRVPCAKGE